MYTLQSGIINTGKVHSKSVNYVFEIHLIPRLQSAIRLCWALTV